MKIKQSGTIVKYLWAILRTDGSLIKDESSPAHVPRCRCSKLEALKLIRDCYPLEYKPIKIMVTTSWVRVVKQPKKGGEG